MAPDILFTPIEFLKGVGPQRAELLKKEISVFVYSDLLHFYPFRYIDRSKFHNISDITDDLPYVQIRGTISSVKLHGAKRTTRMTAILADSSGNTLELVWFNGFKWLKNSFVAGQEYIVFGKPVKYGNKYNIPHPETEPVNQAALSLQTSLQAVYSSTEKLKTRGLDSKGIGKLVRTLFLQVQEYITETMPAEIREELKLPPLRQCLYNIHFPKDTELLSKARLRLKLEELFFLQLNLLNQKQIRISETKGHLFAKVGSNFNNFYNDRLGFDLTQAQKRVIKEIRADTLTGKQMNRLLQGDVGSGKTIVALLSMLIAIDNGYQTCLMAPTEMLANQHYNAISEMLSGLGLEVKLLTGSTRKAERRKILDSAANGTLHLLIGTHALIEDDVIFQKLGLVVIDEQHRFGVAQRARLWKKNSIPPHVLIMTATPIPRTLAMTLYGDLDVSVIDELPSGRKPIRTIHQYDSHRLKIFGFMREQIKEGRQIYVVYPLIKESETLDLKDLQDGYESIVREFPLPEYAISIVHGQMKPADKDFEMQRFVRGETQIMVATTVIEVGINVPNATVMVVENAERFGLSQLHQLRGRVGRGADQSYCILVTNHKISTDARTRIQTMTSTNDGFLIAETDLRLRGFGEIEGTRQSGIIELKIADLSKDEKILKYARQKAADILERDPELKLPENKVLALKLRDMNRNKINWGEIS